MRSKLFLGALALMFMVSSAAFAAESEQSATQVSGKMYIQWVKTLSNSPADEGEQVNTFQLQRAYLQFKHQLDQVWSVKVTLDAGNDAGGSDTRYLVYVKNAYVQAKLGMGVANLTLQFGMVGTAAIGIIDKVSDYRWLNNNYLDAAKKLLAKSATTAQGRSIDTSADMGVSAALQIAKIVTVTAQVTNGEGYKKTDETDSGNDDGKAYLGMVTVQPIPGLYIAGYMRHQITDDAESGDNYIRYYGGTLAYSTDLIKVGVSYIAATRSHLAAPYTGTASETDYTIIDAFLNVNLQSVAGVPVLIAGRYAQGVTEFDDTAGTEITTSLWAVGLGYKFSKNVRMMAYYEVYSSESNLTPTVAALDWDEDDERFYVKCEVTF